jgi:hypothetical protein
VAGDWDGNGTTTVGVVDPSGNWYLRDSNSAGPPDVGPFPYGLGGWTPVAGHWNIPALSTSVQVLGAAGDAGLTARLARPQPPAPAALVGTAAAAVPAVEGLLPGGPGSPLVAFPGPAADPRSAGPRRADALDALFARGDG